MPSVTSATKTASTASKTKTASSSSYAGFNQSAAVSYNRGRGYSKDTWKMIQKTVGTTADGDPGPNTAKAIYNWQKNNGLEADGMCGPATLAAVKASSGSSSSTTTTDKSTSTSKPSTSKTPSSTSSVNIDVSSAVTFNRGRAYPSTTWKKIQEMVGTTADGDPGPATAKAIAVWQSAHNLEVDGKCGNGTLKAMGIKVEYPGTDGQAQKEAVAYAKQFVGKEYPELFKLIPTLTDTRGYAECNGGHTNNCANFVSAILRPYGLLTTHQLGVTNLKHTLINMGYHQVDKSSAKPGDVYITASEGHTELVYSNGATQLIGSNNYKTGYQKCSIANPSSGAKYYSFRNS